MYNCFLEIAYEAELKTDEDPELQTLAAETCGEDPNTRQPAIQELRNMIYGKLRYEIAYEAELKTDEDPELQVLAAETYGEDPNTRQTAIQELRNHIHYERGECLPHRTDDAYMVKFLRARNFVVPRAHRLLVRYCDFKKQYPTLYQGVDMWDLMRLKEVYEWTLTCSPKYGKITIMRFGAMDPNEFPAETLIQAGLLIMEIALRNPLNQVLGSTFIVDLEGVTLRHVTALTPTIAYQVVSLLGLVMPNRLNACHIINYSRIINTFFYLFKRYIPENFNDKVYFHGSNLTSLQKHIDLDFLSVKYGGNDRTITSLRTWLSKVKKYRTEEFDREFRAMGYVVKE